MTCFWAFAVIWLPVQVSWFLVKKSFSIDLVRLEKVSIISIDNVTYLVNCLCTVFLITQTSATNVQCDYRNWGHRRTKLTDQITGKIILNNVHSKKVGNGPISSSQENTNLLIAQNLNNDSKRFSRKHNVSPGNVFLFKTLHFNDTQETYVWHKLLFCHLLAPVTVVAL